MPPLAVNLRTLIEQIDQDLPDADALAKVSEAQQRARSLNDIGDQLIDHFVAQARAGGGSWSQIGEALGVSKQAAQQRRGPTIYQRFTSRARHVVVIAQEQARSHKHDYIGTEHLLLAVQAEEGGLGAQILAEFGGSLERIQETLGKALMPGTENPPTHIPFTPKAKRVLEEAARSAMDLGHDFVGTEHLLLGLFRVSDGIAAQALGELNIAEDRVRAEVANRVTATLAELPDTTG